VNEILHTQEKVCQCEKGDEYSLKNLKVIL